MMKKLFTEIPSIVKPLIVESKENNSKDFYIEGVFATAGLLNANGRIYSHELWKEAVDKYQEQIVNRSKNTLCALEHVDTDYQDLSKVVGVVKELFMEGDEIKGKIKLLDNPLAAQLKSILVEGIDIGISSKGTGDVRLDESGHAIVTEFELLGFDIVSDASDQSAYVRKLKESKGISFIKDEIITKPKTKFKFPRLKESYLKPVINKNDILNFIKTLR